MKDFDSFYIKRLITLAVGSVLLVSGCSAEGSAARKYCTNYKECDEDGFDDEFDSIGECVKLNRLQTKASIYAAKIESGPECSTALKRMAICYSRQLTCDAFPGEDADAGDLADSVEWAIDMAEECEEQIEDVADECDSGSYSGADYF